MRTLQILTDMTVQLGLPRPRQFMDVVASHHRFNRGAMASLVRSLACLGRLTRHAADQYPSR